MTRGVLEIGPATAAERAAQQLANDMARGLRLGGEMARRVQAAQEQACVTVGGIFGSSPAAERAAREQERLAARALAPDPEMERMARLMAEQMKPNPELERIGRLMAEQMKRRARRPARVSRLERPVRRAGMSRAPRRQRVARHAVASRGDPPSPGDPPKRENRPWQSGSRSGHGRATDYVAQARPRRPQRHRRAS